METKPKPEPFIFNTKHNSFQVLKILEALKQASHFLHKNPNSTKLNDAIKPLLDLQLQSESLLSTDPHLSTLSTHLNHLKTLINNPCSNNNNNQERFNGIKSFLTRRVNSLELSRLGGSIEVEIRSWAGREFVFMLAQKLQLEKKDEVLVDLVEQFVERIKNGFDRDFQDSILKLKVFNGVERILCDGKYAVKVRETCGFAITELVKFNKDVFVGLVLMGESVHALVSLASVRSIQVLSMLVKLIKCPIVDEIESKGEIANIIKLLSCEELEIRAVAMDCVLEIGYYGRKDVIEAMLEEDLVKRLVELKREETGGAFSRCVVRFAVQLEVGEGLRRREKRALKQEVLRRVREAHVSEAEAATIVAEVLWGASP